MIPKGFHQSLQPTLTGLTNAARPRRRSIARRGAGAEVRKRRKQWETLSENPPTRRVTRTATRRGSIFLRSVRSTRPTPPRAGCDTVGERCLNSRSRSMPQHSSRRRSCSESLVPRNKYEHHGSVTALDSSRVLVSRVDFCEQMRFIAARRALLPARRRAFCTPSSASAPSALAASEELEPTRRQLRLLALRRCVAAAPRAARRTNGTLLRLCFALCTSRTSLTRSLSRRPPHPSSCALI